MAAPDVSAKSFISELMRLSLNIIWKDPYYANTKEDVGTRIDVETYLASRNGVLAFNSVFQFHEEVLQAFFPDADELAIVLGNKDMIPEEMRDPIVAAESAYMIDYWENQNGETNDYYRMLFGLPPIEFTEKQWVYNTRYADIDMTIPLHLLPYTERLKLENRGYFAELRAQSEYSDDAYAYIDHLGMHRVYPYVSRQAEYFQLLYVIQSTYEYLRNDFIEEYEKARRMVVRVYYSNAYRNNSHLYEGFLGLCILFITQQRMFSKYLEADTTRNFYDLESLKLLYDAYSVPFYSEIPLRYHERIVKHLNQLLRYKGTTQVFYDLFELFDFGIMDVFEYYLVKERITDEYGNPVFRDAKGELLPVEKMWNIFFSKVGWRDDKFVEVTNKANRVEYEDLTVPDPYWVEDLSLRKKLYETDWNYFQSKYMGVQIMFELSKLIFEMCYFLGMLRDNREPLSQLTVYYSPLGYEVPIFDMLVYTIAILCKNAGFTGEIPSDPASVAAIYGFNFREYNQLLKMGSENMNDFVKQFKALCKQFVDENEVLAMDQTLYYLIDQITDGAFNWLGDDFPYNSWGHAPTPIFLHDFTPTNNSVTNLKKYLRETVAVLKDNPDLTEFELQYIYRQVVTKDNYTFEVIRANSTAGNLQYDKFIVKFRDFTDEDLDTLRQAVIASYDNMLTWIIKLLDARTSLTFDPNILEMIGNMNIDSIDDIDRLYSHMMELNEYINVKIRTAIGRVDFEAYANLRKILMTTGVMNSTFQKQNGTVASSYSDLLQDINLTLYNRWADDELDLISEEQYAIQTLMKLCDDLTYLESINTNNIKRIVDYLFLILKFFKSAKVDLVDFQIIYLITDRGMNYIKLISEIYEQGVTFLLTKTEVIQLEDFIWITRIIQYIDSKLHILEAHHAVDIHQIICSIFEEMRSDLTAEIEHTFGSPFEFIFGEIRQMDLTIFIKQDKVPWREVLIKASETLTDENP